MTGISTSQYKNSSNPVSHKGHKAWPFNPAPPDDSPVSVQQHDHISQGVKSLGWLSIEDKLRLSTAVMVHKCLHHRVPIHLFERQICI